MAVSKNKISLRDVSKSFGSKKVLEAINLDVKKGESLVVIGGSGSGKSVLIKMIIGLLKPSSGHVFIDGESTETNSYHKKSHIMEKFGVLFQGGALFDSLTIWENISFGLLQTKKVDKEQAKDIAAAKLSSVGLSSDIMYLAPSELSGGMQKRVALARAIAANPEVIFFDEPTAGLDPIMSDVINHLIADRSKELGATTVTITHDMKSVRTIANKIAMIYQGKIIWQGTVEDMDNSDNPYLHQFVNGLSEGPITVNHVR